MNASQMHLWILQTLDPLKEAAWTEMNAHIGVFDEESERAYYRAAGRHQGLSLAISAGLDLVQKLQAEEQEAQMKALIDSVTVCDRCGMATDDPDLWDPEADTGRVLCNPCWLHRDEPASDDDLAHARTLNTYRFGLPQLSR